MPCRDIRNPGLLYLKGLLFLVLGGLAAGLLLLDCHSLKSAGLLILSIWSFARAYYFAFYVIGHYIDPSYRFAGLLDLARYLIGRPDQGSGGGKS